MFFVAFRSKYTRASSPGGGSSLTRLVGRAPRPHRETGRPRRSRGFHHRLLARRGSWPPGRWEKAAAAAGVLRSGKRRFQPSSRRGSAIGTEQPVKEVKWASSPGGGSAGDASRLNCAPTGRTGASRRSSLRFHRNTVGIPPSRALSAGLPPAGLPPPGELGLPGLDPHITPSTGC